MVSTQWYFAKSMQHFSEVQNTNVFFFCEYKTQTFACGVLEHVYNAHTQDQMCIHIHRACVIIYMCRYTIKVLEALPMHKRDTDNLLHLFDK